HDRRRTFRVDAGSVAVLVLGTEFTVERMGEIVAVSVERGRVRVEWDRGQAELEAGERGAFPPTSGGPRAGAPVDAGTAFVEPAGEGVAAPPARAPAPAAPPPPAPPSARSSKHAEERDDWRTLAERGEYDGAWKSLENGAPPTDAMEELLLAADVARLSGHSAQAVPHLERALEL